MATISLVFFYTEYRSYRSGGARGSYSKRSGSETQVKPPAHILETSRLNFIVQIKPFKYLGPSHTCENGSEYPHRPPNRINDIPLYSIGLSVNPPNVTILVWCRSNIRVAKWAHVDAHFPLPTRINSSAVVKKTSKEYHTDDYVAGQLVLASMTRGKNGIDTHLRSIGGVAGMVTFRSEHTS
jgi:hypothetical protein